MVLGLRDRFRFAGQRSDVLRLLAGADFFVLPSRQEGLPVVIMEATCAGVTLVVTSVGELPLLFTNGVDALVVPPIRPTLWPAPWPSWPATRTFVSGSPALRSPTASLRRDALRARDRSRLRRGAAYRRRAKDVTYAGLLTCACRHVPTVHAGFAASSAA